MSEFGASPLWAATGNAGAALSDALVALYGLVKYFQWDADESLNP